MTFQEKLVVLRKIKGVTQDEFASVVGVSRQAVYKWESGQSYPEVEKLLAMKQFFEISIDDLLDNNFEVQLPEKKRRKKRMDKEVQRTIEKIVEAEESGKEVDSIDATLDALLNDLKAEPVPAAAPAPKAAPAPVAEAPKAEPVAAPAPEAEPAAAPAPKAEDEENPLAKRGGLFGRIFGKR